MAYRSRYHAEDITINTVQLTNAYWSVYCRNVLTTRKFADMPCAASISREVFHRAFYDLEPNWLSAIGPEHQWAKKIHEHISGSPRWVNLFNTSQGKPAIASIITQQLGDTLGNILGDKEEEIEKNSDRLKQLRQDHQQAIASGDQAKADQAMAEGKQLAEEMIAMAEAFGDQLGGDDGSSCLPSTMEGLASMLTDKVDDVINAARALGLAGDDGDLKNLDTNAALKLANHYTNHNYMNNIMENAGRLFSLAVNQETEAIDVAEFGEFYDYSLGSNIRNVHSNELIHLDEPTEDLFFSRLLSNELLVSDRQSEGPKVGPIVMCCDVSGSMDGTSNECAKGLMIALARKAQRDERDIHVILFSSDVKREVTIHHDDPEHVDKLLKLASAYVGGGTDFNRPIRRAMAFMKNSPDFEKADIVFLTDDLSMVNGDVREEVEHYKRESGLRFYSVIMGDGRTTSAVNSEKGDPNTELSLVSISNRAWGINIETQDFCEALAPMVSKV